MAVSFLQGCTSDDAGDIEIHQTPFGKIGKASIEIGLEVANS
jgi:hypothetical protein